MGEPFKNLLNATLVGTAAAHLQRVDPGFDARRFTALASHGLDALEMKARAMQICDALEATLPADFDAAAALLEAALAPPIEGEQMAGLSLGEKGLAGWILWPAGEYIARRGQASPERALAALHAITQRFTAEFAIRPFIVAHPALAFATLRRWAGDPSHHVRRLVSEGSRPRLPWGLQLKALINDPTPTLPLLQALQDDPSEYVRRSVGNHLNDIAKDHPDCVADWLDAHLPGASPERRALLRHASRTLVKRGDVRVLRAWGIGQPLRGSATLALSSGRIRVGDTLRLHVRLVSIRAKAQTLAIDYAVHHVKAHGGRSPKVFKGWTVELPPHGSLELHKTHSMRAVTTRRYHPGLHTVALQINGRVEAEADFILDPAG
jgi:3-methyladenine DNA glycosylase AlkC